MAPEVVGKRGHSFEVDVWSLGCVMYTLFVGVPPFKTQRVPDTYAKILKSQYKFPAGLSENSKKLIQRMLQLRPLSRPSMADLLLDDFFTQEPPRFSAAGTSTAITSKKVPHNVKKAPPRFSAAGTSTAITSKKVPHNVKKGPPRFSVARKSARKTVHSSRKLLRNVKKGPKRMKTSGVETPGTAEADYEPDPKVDESMDCLSEMFQQLSPIMEISSTPAELHGSKRMKTSDVETPGTAEADYEPDPEVD